MKDALAQLQARLAQLAPRERLLVIGGGIVLLITLLYLLLWEPLVLAHTQRAAALQSERALATRIEVAAAEAQRNRGSGNTANLSMSLLAAVDQTSRSPTLGKAPARVQPEGEREVKVWLEGVAFDNLLRWLQELETRYGISASSAEIERGDAAGTVSARLTLVRG
jgi:general secretion pathway protein M